MLLTALLGLRLRFLVDGVFFFLKQEEEGKTSFFLNTRVNYVCTGTFCVNDRNKVRDTGLDRM